MYSHLQNIGQLADHTKLTNSNDDYKPSKLVDCLGHDPTPEPQLSRVSTSENSIRTVRLIYYYLELSDP